MEFNASGWVVLFVFHGDQHVCMSSGISCKQEADKTRLRLIGNGNKVLFVGKAADVVRAISEYAGDGGDVNKGPDESLVSPLPSITRVSEEEIVRLFHLCERETEHLSNSGSAMIGFIVGFRCYERMATMLGKQMSDSECKRFVPTVTSR